MKHDSKHIKALVFDMDGTLWDATESYAEVWNESMRQLGICRSVNVADLHKLMGAPVDAMIDFLVGTDHLGMSHDEFLELLYTNERTMMPRLGGVLYPGVFDGFVRLSSHYRLMLLSNCSPNGLINFMGYTGLGPFVADHICYGDSPRPKSENLRILLERNGITSAEAVYVGDTQSDCYEAHKAGTIFALMEYGFGNADDADLRFASFHSLTEYFEI